MTLLSGVITLIGGLGMVACWGMAGERQAAQIKSEYVRSILRQDQGWFDEHPAGELPTRVTSSLAKIQDGIGRKVSDLIFNFTAFVGTFIVAFLTNAELSGIMLASIPMVGGGTVIVIKVMSQSSEASQTHYAKAGAVANEVLGSIRTVASLCSESFEVIRYGGHLVNAEKMGIIGGLQKGLGNGFMLGSFFCCYALAFWYGARQVADDLERGCVSNCKTGGDVIIAVFGVLFAAMSLGQMAPGMTALSLALSAAVPVFETLDRVPTIDTLSDEGKTIEDVHGELQFEHAAFSYPARPDDLVYSGINLTIKAGESLALVGPSGGGKSTMTKLLLRFYDPTFGSICMDGVPLTELNVRWYRSQIGYVGQEPVLFAGSILSNISYGKPGCSMEEVIAAAKAANAHNFITKFPQGYDTECGQGGLQLSGGQKQRISIARAIICEPSILILDEATSALDSESEKVVQDALVSLREQKKRTTITIAHRLSTIQDCDRIAVVANKGIAELGTHAELMESGGIYAELCALQRSGTAEDEDEAAGQDAVLARQRSGSLGRRLSRGGSDATVSVHQPTRGFNLTHASKCARLPYLGSASIQEEELPNVGAGRLWALNAPDWPYICLGLIGALVAGSLFPLEGLLIATIQANFYTTDFEQLRRDANEYAIYFAVLGAAAMVGHTMLAYGFAVAGERMTRKLRAMCFKAFLGHDIGWFDKEENALGNLTIRLEEDAGKVHNATGTNLAHKVQLVVTLLMGVIIGLIVAWQVGLAAIALIPMMAFAGIIQMAMLTGRYNDDEGLDGGTSAGVILGGSLNNMTTVAAFNMQSDVSKRYGDTVMGTVALRTKKAILAGAAFGYSQAVMFWVFAVLFYVGAVLVDKGDVSFENFFQAMFAVMMGAFGIGQINMDINAGAEGQIAANRIFKAVDEPKPLDPFNPDGAKPTSTEGRLSFKGIKFAYPARPDQQIYGSKEFPNGFNLEVEPGETVALVGPSGAGKSTGIALLLRFYEASAGEIRLDGRDIKELNLHWLRHQFGYVGQEPSLFMGTIKENIAKGKADATDDEIIAAAQAANAHDFITAFTDGYDTEVGEKSALLSGGQKQRIAIARAIVSDPPCLLLDEATSALDNESEKVVQEALNGLQALKKRTTMVVAHRLTTIKNADKIAVLSGGGVKELGTHAELLAKKGIFYKLWERQTAKF
ncbi:unnamed protein product [Chrysoparadoxa australica]